ncbi:EcsC family protein [Floridanema evergladense]|uniref:EcsC family protein n=1 Tax=Floridaenema evergladense BLCC-F167 TaxID=3153639 RepID=A0ABV4WM14_9CYAN
MLNVEFKVVHKVFGRIRLKIPMLKSNPDYGWLLEKLVKSIEMVKEVRINPLASSLVVEYDRHAISEADLQAKLESAIHIANHPVLALHLQPFLAYEAIDLSEYEATQLTEIEEWLDKQKPFGIKELTGYVFQFLKKIVNFIVPSWVFKKIGTACEAATKNWQHDWQKIKPEAQVEEYTKLRYSKLEVCDRLSEQIINHSRKEAFAIGSFAALTELGNVIVGEVGDSIETMTYGLKTIHRIGLCYGYAPESPQEQAFVWGIFNIATAQTEQEWEEARRTLQSLSLNLDKVNLEEGTVEDLTEKKANRELIDSAVKGAIYTLTQSTASQLIPLYSFVVDTLGDMRLIEGIAKAAKREYQLRWLLDNQKISFFSIAPSTN